MEKPGIFGTNSPYQIFTTGQYWKDSRVTRLPWTFRIFEFGLFWTEILNKKNLRQNSMKVFSMVDPERNLKNLKFSLVVFHGKFCKMMMTFGNLPPNLDMLVWVQNCKTSHNINF